MRSVEFVRLFCVFRGYMGWLHVIGPAGWSGRVD